MKKYLDMIVMLVLVPMPSSFKKHIYRNFYGAEIDDTAKIGLSYLHAKKIILGAGARVGHFNIIRNLEVFEIGEMGRLGSFNQASAVPLSKSNFFKASPSRNPSFKIGRHASVVSNHYFDCNDAIEIGDFSTVAGRGSTFFTHGIDIETNTQVAAPIKIGKYCIVSARCTVVKGAVLPDNSALGAASMLHKPYTETHRLYSGVPAVAIKSLDPESKYFHRANGFVD